MIPLSISATEVASKLSGIALTSPEGVDSVDSETVSLVSCIGKLRGSSQPLLATASDGAYYVVKFQTDLVGLNTLFNEAAGTELYRALGLPVPEWRQVNVSEKFFERNRSWFHAEANGNRVPRTGIAFGSRFVSGSKMRIMEVLPSAAFKRIDQPERFWLAWLVDVCAFHSDNRQAIFTQGERTNLGTVFIDHGRMFGGAAGDERPHPIACRYLDSRIYPELPRGVQRRIVEKLMAMDLEVLKIKISHLPESWVTDSGAKTFLEALHRLAQRGVWDNVLEEITQLMSARNDDESDSK